MPYSGDWCQSGGSGQWPCGCSLQLSWTARLSRVCYLVELYAQVQLPPSNQHRTGLPMATVSLRWCGPLLSRSMKLSVLLDAVTLFTYQDWYLKSLQESQTMEVVVSRVWEEGERTSHPPEALQHVHHCRIIELFIAPLLKPSRRADWWTAARFCLLN